jgi:hypothetical protein
VGFFFSVVDIVARGESVPHMQEADICGFRYPGLAPADRKNASTSFIDFGQIDSFLEQDLMSWYVVYSPSGKWGAWVDLDNYLFLGGVPEFGEVLQEQLPDIEDYTREYIQFFRWLTPRTWRGSQEARKSLRRMLAYAYGAKRADALLGQDWLDDRAQAPARS